MEKIHYIYIAIQHGNIKNIPRNFMPFEPFGSVG